MIATKKAGVAVRNGWSTKAALLTRLWRSHKSLCCCAEYKIGEEIVLQLYKYLTRKRNKKKKNLKFQTPNPKPSKQTNNNKILCDFSH